MTYQTDTTSSEQTEQLAETLGRKLRLQKGSEVVELASDLGGGKTTFVRGLARGLGSTDHVASPTFTISREYQATGRRLYHYDFYRLADAGVMSSELAEAIADPAGVVAIEWANVVESVLPNERITVKIEVLDESIRRLTFVYYEELEPMFLAMQEEVQ